ncbi:hypothetical protein [Nocardia asiatica]|uniref:hypothetical protein n=1 Tax=Nocardia asiatica TaxID=209252 RepID=UPI00245882D3|nr:hypothetical protein [Nocardia asiatica]
MQRQRPESYVDAVVAAYDLIDGHFHERRHRLCVQQHEQASDAIWQRYLVVVQEVSCHVPSLVGVDRGRMLPRLADRDNHIADVPALRRPLKECTQVVAHAGAGR